MNRKQNSLMRFSRTERLAQLSEQEIVIERKKREIQAKLEAQKKKQTEEALKKLETSRETKKPGFSKKSWSGAEHHKNTSKEKSVEQVKESLTNAFSNDGSFLDQFKKLSQTGLSASPVDMKTSGTTAGSKKIQDIYEDIGSESNEKVGSSTARQINESKLSFIVQSQLDSRVQFQIPPPGVVHLLPQHQNVSPPSTIDNSFPSHSVFAPQFQGGMQNSINAFSSQNTFLNSSQSGNVVQFPQSGSVFSLAEKDGSVSSKLSHDQFSMTTLPCVQPALPITPPNIPPLTPIQVQNVPTPPVAPSELPKLRSESISMTLKSNTVKKLEAIPNPLEVDQSPSPSPSPKRDHLSCLEVKESSKGFLNTSSIVENVSSNDRESLRISSAFFNNDEDGEEGDLSDEKYHHWARLIARCGDSFEDSLQNRNQNDPDIQFLLNKNSKEYLSFRKLVSMYRRQLRSSGEPSEKILKLNFSHEKPVKELISSDEGKYYRAKSSDEENSDSNEPLGSERSASFGRRENQTHSRHYETREDYPHQNKASSLTSKEDSLLSSSKLSKEGLKENLKDQKTLEHFKNEERPKRRRKSRWGDAVPTTSTPGVATNISLQPAGKLPAPKSTLLSQLTRSDPGLIQYARQTFGSTNLSEEDWKKAEDHYKINLLYQDMVKKRAEVEKLEKQGKFKYEYDSDEDTEGGTWEHKLRQQEMQATQLWAEELTRQAAGKHHIGDFLPPEELERFMEKYNAVKEGREPDLSDYKEYKLKEDNVGYRLLQKMGWNEGQGLGQDGSGITNPVNKATTRHENQGLGVERPDGLEPGDDEYDAYRKRMMLAYRFRPNPLNNPRRPYY